MLDWVVWPMIQWEAATREEQKKDAKESKEIKLM
jgi:hypothetical protein